MAKCSAFLECGGCTLQDKSYEAQLEIKKKQLSFASGADEVFVFPSKDFYYRNRMEFLFWDDGLGLRKKDMPEAIIPISKCPLVEEYLNILYKEINSFVKKKSDVFSGVLKAVVIRGANGISTVSFVLKNDSKEAVKSITRKKISANNVIITYISADNHSNYSDDYTVAKGKELLCERMNGFYFFFHAQGFFQNNSRMAELMQEHVNSILRKYETKNSDLLDLYSGVGTFGIINSGLFRRVTFVESGKKSAGCARMNIEHNKVFNARVFEMPSNHIARIKFFKDLIVIADPPRSGMDEKTIELVKRLKPKVLIFVSCNVKKLSRDIPKFKNYSVKSAAMFDFFPQTDEFESVVEMVRR